MGAELAAAPLVPPPEYEPILPRLLFGAERVCGATYVPSFLNWIAWALLSAFFSGMTAGLAKIGVAGVDSNLATAVRTTVVMVGESLLNCVRPVNPA
jgi:hypothetical protein